jgi:phenylalanyl-tRNA synthetase beta chain
LDYGLFDVLGYAADDARRDTVTLANPLQDEAPLMRTSLLDTLLETLRRNVSRGMRDVAVYELGLVTRGSVPKGGAPILPVSSRPDPESEARLYAAVPPQPRHVAFAAAGLAQGSGPWGSSRGFDASDAVTWAREVGEILGIQLQVAAATMAPWHPGRCAAISLPDGRVVGWAGELHPKVLGALKLPARTVAGELDLDLLTEASLAPISAVKLSTFPLATTDVALTVDETVPVGEVEAALRRGAGPLLESLSLFDLFRGEQVGAGKKSLAFHLAVRAPDRTLTTDEVSAIRDQAVAAAARDCGAVQR